MLRVEAYIDEDEVFDNFLGEIETNKGLRERVLEHLNIDSATLHTSIPDISDILRKQSRIDLAVRLDELRETLS